MALSDDAKLDLARQMAAFFRAFEYVEDVLGGVPQAKQAIIDLEAKRASVEASVEAAQVVATKAIEAEQDKVRDAAQASAKALAEIEARETERTTALLLEGAKVADEIKELKDRRNTDIRQVNKAAETAKANYDKAIADGEAQLVAALNVAAEKHEQALAGLQTDLEAVEAKIGLARLAESAALKKAAEAQARLDTINAELKAARERLTAVLG